MVTHIAGTTNVIADAVSCLQIGRFKQLARNAADLPDPSLHGPPSFGQTAHSVPVTRCCSINPPYIPSWGPFIFAIL